MNPCIASERFFLLIEPSARLARFLKQSTVVGCRRACAALEEGQQSLGEILSVSSGQPNQDLCIVIPENYNGTYFYACTENALKERLNAYTISITQETIGLRSLTFELLSSGGQQVFLDFHYHFLPKTLYSQ